MHFARPWFNRPDPVSGEPAKQAYSDWMLGALRLLARLKILRGTPLDVFGYSAERRMERALCNGYASTVALLVEQLDAGSLPLACRIASVPDRILGFGPVKMRHAEAARAQLAELMGLWSRRDSNPAEASTAVHDARTAEAVAP